MLFRKLNPKAGKWSRWWAILSGPGDHPWRAQASSPWTPIGSATTPSCIAAASSSIQGTTRPRASGSMAGCIPCSRSPSSGPRGSGMASLPAFLYTGFALVMPPFVSYAQGWEVMQPERLPRQARAWKVLGDQLAPCPSRTPPPPPEHLARAQARARKRTQLQRSSRLTGSGAISSLALDRNAPTTERTIRQPDPSRCGPRVSGPAHGACGEFHEVPGRHLSSVGGAVPPRIGEQGRSLFHDLDDGAVALTQTTSRAIRQFFIQMAWWSSSS